MDLASARYEIYSGGRFRQDPDGHCLKEIRSDILNNSGYKGKGVCIAFIDTGIYPHPDF